MTVKEITGQPCSGKSSYIAKEVIISNEIQAYKMENLTKILIFFRFFARTPKGSLTFCLILDKKS